MTKHNFTKQYRATAVCSYCDWTAVHQDDDPIALAEFLRARMIDHTTLTHGSIDTLGPPKTDEEILAAARAARGDTTKKEDA